MIAHQNPYFSVDLNDDYYSLSFPTEQVVVLPVVDEHHILFIKAIRPVFEDPVIELPAGTVDKGETIEVAALREFSEETGVKINNIDRLVKMPSINNMPSRTNNLLNVFKINISMAEYNDRVDHDSEVSETFLMTNNNIVNNINKGHFFTSPFIAICLLYIINSKDLYYKM
jgi:ADP-ribose pyrophosphatase